MSKGSDFEREFCTRLSLWWTEDSNNPRDDVFWRTQNSGGRATTRAKQHKTTAGQYGDIAATCPEGQPFTELFTVELKRGYSDSTPFNLLDKSDRLGSKTCGPQVWEEWYVKTVTTAARAGSPWWLLITRRDHRRAWVYVPESCNRLLQLQDYLYLRPHLDFTTISHGHYIQVFGFLLDDLFDTLSPSIFLDAHREWRDPNSSFLKGDG